MEDIVDAEGGVGTVVGGAETASLFNVGVAEEGGGLLVDVGCRGVVEIAGEDKGGSGLLDKGEEFLFPFLFVAAGGLGEFFEQAMGGAVGFGMGEVLEAFEVVGVELIGVEVDATDAHRGAMHVDVGVEFGLGVHGVFIDDGIAGEEDALGDCFFVDSIAIRVAAVGKAVGELDMA